MDRQHTNNEKTEKAATQTRIAEKAHRTTQVEKYECLNATHEKELTKSEPTREAMETDTMIIKVETQRTFLTGHGRKFPPRGIRQLDLSSAEHVGAALRRRVPQLYPKLPGQFTLMIKGRQRLAQYTYNTCICVVAYHLKYTVENYRPIRMFLLF